MHSYVLQYTCSFTYSLLVSVIRIHTNRNPSWMPYHTHRYIIYTPSSKTLPLLKSIYTDNWTGLSAQWSTETTTKNKNNRLCTQDLVSKNRKYLKSFIKLTPPFTHTHNLKAVVVSFTAGSHSRGEILHLVQLSCGIIKIFNIKINTAAPNI